MRRAAPYVAVAALGLAAAPAAGESLYVASTYRSLTEDRKAFRVGDVLTVQVYENSSASTSTDTSTRRNNALAASLGASAVAGGRNLTGAVNLGGTFDGGGTTQRANRLLATVTVRVREVLPGGDLRLAGAQSLTVNAEEQRVIVEGIARPQDVSPDNVVLSTRLADARIDYAGDGDLSQRGRRGWWRRLVDWLGF